MDNAQQQGKKKLVLLNKLLEHRTIAITQVVDRNKHIQEGLSLSLFEESQPFIGERRARAVHLEEEFGLCIQVREAEGGEISSLQVFTLDI